jgi:hypothetical protein
VAANAGCGVRLRNNDDRGAEEHEQSESRLIGRHVKPLVRPDYPAPA